MKKEPDQVSRRDFIKTAGAGLITAAALSQTACVHATAGGSSEAKGRENTRKLQPAGGGPYNIVFILTDQERYFEAYPQSANLETRGRMRELGVSFRNHYTCSNVCTASRSVIYTGRHIQQTGMFDNTNSPWQPDMRTDLPTIGHRLREAGYYTAYKGKLHLSRKAEPDDSGELKTDALEPYGFADYNPEGDEYGHVLGGYGHDHGFAGAAVDWLRQKAAALNNDEKKPFFLAVNLVNPHDVMYFNTDEPDTSEQGANGLDKGINLAPNNEVYRTTHPDHPLPDDLYHAIDAPGRPKAHMEYTRCMNATMGEIPNRDENWRRYRDYYLNCLKDVDMQIGLVLNELEDQGLLDNTMVVFTADHGEMAGHHNLRGKGPFSYEQNIHLPLVVIHPEIQGGQTCDALTTHLDLVPTMLDLSGAVKKSSEKITRDLPGKSMAQALGAPEKAGIDTVRPATLYCYDMLSYVDADFMSQSFDIIMSGGGVKELKAKKLKPDLKKRGCMRTVFDGRYKFTRYFAPVEHNTPAAFNELIRYNDLELFDLEQDPKEMNNLAREPLAQKELIMRMNGIMNQRLKAEVGKDQGQELPANVNWAVTDFTG